MHSQETCTDAANGFASQNLYVAMIISMVVSNLIIDTYGNSYLFIFFGSISLLGLIYSYLFIKDTTYDDDSNRLNDK